MRDKFVSTLVKIVIIILLVILIIFAWVMYSDAKEENSKNDKVEQEIIYMESRITNLVNALNGIKLQNYEIVINKVKEEESSKNADSEEDKKGEDNSESGQSEQENSGQDNNESKEEKTVTKLEEEIIAVQEGEIDWQWFQSETQLFYATWATVILDLYDIGIDSDKIVEFSNAIDETLVSAQNKDKKTTAVNLANLYGILPEFINKLDVTQLEKDVVQTKGYIINAYAYVELEAWDKVQIEVSKAESLFETSVNDIKKDEKEKFNINKAYILIEELKNSLSKEDSGIFYVKYKNLVEELNTFI